MNKKDLRGGCADMQHRHFRTIAAIIRAYPGPYAERQHLAIHFAGHLALTNRNFDRQRFIDACLYGEE